MNNSGNLIVFDSPIVVMMHEFFCQLWKVSCLGALVLALHFEGISMQYKLNMSDIMLGSPPLSLFEINSLVWEICLLIKWFLYVKFYSVVILNLCHEWFLRSGDEHLTCKKKFVVGFLQWNLLVTLGFWAFLSFRSSFMEVVMPSIMVSFFC